MFVCSTPHFTFHIHYDHLQSSSCLNDFSRVCVSVCVCVTPWFLLLYLIDQSNFKWANDANTISICDSP